MTEVEITFEDGKTRTFPKYTTYYEITRGLEENQNILAVMVNNRIHSLNDRAERNQNLKILTLNSTDGNRVYTAGLKMIFEYAVKTVFAKAKV